MWLYRHLPVTLPTFPRDITNISLWHYQHFCVTLPTFHGAHTWGPDPQSQPQRAAQTVDKEQLSSVSEMDLAAWQMAKDLVSFIFSTLFSLVIRQLHAPFKYSWQERALSQFSTVNTSCKVFQGAVNTILCPIKKGRICTITMYSNCSNTAGWCSAFVQPCGQQAARIDLNPTGTPPPRDAEQQWLQCYKRYCSRFICGELRQGICKSSVLNTMVVWPGELHYGLQPALDQVLWESGSYGPKIHANFRSMYQPYTGESMNYEPLHKYVFTAYSNFLAFFFFFWHAITLILTLILMERGQ